MARTLVEPSAADSAVVAPDLTANFDFFTWPQADPVPADAAAAEDVRLKNAYGDPEIEPTLQIQRQETWEGDYVFAAQDESGAISLNVPTFASDPLYRTIWAERYAKRPMNFNFFTPDDETYDGLVRWTALRNNKTGEFYKILDGETFGVNATLPVIA